jgi:hypothetical protein
LNHWDVEIRILASKSLSRLVIIGSQGIGGAGQGVGQEAVKARSGVGLGVGSVFESGVGSGVGLGVGLEVESGIGLGVGSGVGQGVELGVGLEVGPIKILKDLLPNCLSPSLSKKHGAVLAVAEILLTLQSR